MPFGHRRVQSVHRPSARTTCAACSSSKHRQRLTLATPPTSYQPGQTRHCRPDDPRRLRPSNMELVGSPPLDCTFIWSDFRKFSSRGILGTASTPSSQRRDAPSTRKPQSTWRSQIRRRRERRSGLYPRHVIRQQRGAPLFTRTQTSFASNARADVPLRHDPSSGTKSTGTVVRPDRGEAPHVHLPELTV